MTGSCRVLRLFLPPETGWCSGADPFSEIFRHPKLRVELTLLHPKLVHLPISLALLMPVVATVLVGLTWRRRVPQRAWLLAALLQAILVGSGFLATTTGESDAKRVRQVVDERHVDAHEDAAELFVWFGLTMLIPFVQAGLARDVRRSRAFAVAAAAGSIVVLVLAVRTGNAGGDLVYRYGAANAFIQAEADSTRSDGRN